MSHWEPHKYPKPSRDSQRLKEYRSEWALARDLGDDTMDKAAMAVYLRTITHDPWFQERFGTVTFAICFSKRRRTRASCKRRYPEGLPIYSLHFPDNDKNTTLLALHEMVHVLCYDQCHGPIFCSVMLQIVLRYMGVAAGRALNRLFAVNAVKLVQ